METDGCREKKARKTDRVKGRKTEKEENEARVKRYHKKKSRDNGDTQSCMS